MTTLIDIEAPVNRNYAATVIKLGTPHTLEGLDNLIGFPVFGCQALTTKDHEAGELMIAFVAGTRISEEFARANNLYRDFGLNSDPLAEPGYLEANRQVRAIRLRGHRSDALLLPVSCVEYTGIDPTQLEAGMTFDHLNGHEICRKFVVPVKVSQQRTARQAERVFRRVTNEIFPIHVDTANFWKAFPELKPYGAELIVTQKLHGTSARFGRVPALNPPVLVDPVPARFNRVREFFGFPPKFKEPATTRPAGTMWSAEPEFVAGSKMVVKDLDAADDDAQARTGYYKVDVWSDAARELELESKIPENFVVYGELIGWLPGTNMPIQKNYTYNLLEGRYELYVYRVAVINRTGQIADLSWDAVKTFCTERGLKWVPEYARIPAPRLKSMDGAVVINQIESYLDVRHEEDFQQLTPDSWRQQYREKPVPLSNPDTVDEGVCVRQDNIVPTILKAKAGTFLRHESKLNDKGVVDIESAEATEGAEVAA